MEQERDFRENESKDCDSIRNRNEKRIGCCNGNMGDLCHCLGRVEMVDSTSETTEKQMIDRQTVKNTTRFTVRHRADITEKMRISFESKTFDILRIITEPEKQFMFIEAQSYK